MKGSKLNYPKNRYTGEKPWMDKDWLYNQYVVNDKSTKDIANEYGCKRNTIQQWLSKHKISKPVVKRDYTKKQYHKYNYLYHQYVELGKTIKEIADSNQVSYDTIRSNLIKNGIEIIKVNPHKKYTTEDVDKMVKLYTEENLSTNKIAQEFETDHGTIKRYLKSRGVNLRGMSEAQFVLNKKEIPPELYDKEYLQKLHWEENKSCKEIGHMFNIDAGTLRRQMHRLGIKTKTNAESKVGLMVGDTHPNWQGGRTPLKNLLREFFTNNQAPVIAKRDNYTCQLCGAAHVVLHVHHIIKFSDIVDEICEEHTDLNPDNMDDRLKLYSIITHDKRFLDENNLITFCEDCHLFKIHNYTKRKTISSQASNEEGSTTIP